MAPMWSAIDLSPTLVDLARERTPSSLGEGTVELPSYPVICSIRRSAASIMRDRDGLAHPLSSTADMAAAVAGLVARVDRSSLVFTFAPRTPALTLMYAAGKLLFPRSDRSPAIVAT